MERFMNRPTPSTAPGFWTEVRSIGGHVCSVWRMIERRDRWVLGFALALMTVISVCNTIFPVLQGWMLDSIQEATRNNDPNHAIFRTAFFYLGTIALVFLIREAIVVFRSYIVERSCTQIEKAMTVKLFSHLMRIDLGSLTEDKIGAIQGRLTRDVVGFVRFLRLAFLDFLPPLLTGALALLVVVTKNWVLGLTMVAVVPVTLFLTLRQLSSQKGIRLNLIESRETLDGAVVEQLAGLDYIRAANTQDFEIERVERVAESRRAMELRHHTQMSFYTCAKALNQGFFHILVLCVSAYLAIRGDITFGDVLTFSFFFGNVMAPLNEVHRGLDEGHECSLAVADLMQMLAEPHDRSFAPRDVREPKVVSGEAVVDIDGLVVEYATAVGVKRALDGVSTKVKHGETIGLAGPSGCGKTTWLKVLLRLAAPSAGRVELGGAPIETVSREAIGRLVGYVSQTPFIFAGSIADNIRYGNPSSSEEAVRDAAERACIHDDIMAMPGNYTALVNEKGRNLSVGQHQRIALARVFLKNPPILILDEGTSALDTISERHIQRAIDLARKDRTVILVAHRLSTLLDADRIYVFQAGKVIEAGAYEELYRQGGAFTALVDSAGVGTK
jgi:ATP-binding cassette subfamily B protein